MPGSHPRLPDAERVAERVADELRAWRRGRAGAPSRWIRGQRGVGKSYAASRVVDAAKEHHIPVMEIRPPKLGLDSFAQLSLQGAGSLREAQVNGVLDPAFRADVSWDDKAAALLRGLHEVEDRGLLLLDLPSSWDRDPETPEHRKTQLVAMRCVRDLTGAAIQRGWAVLLATSQLWTQASWLGNPEPLEIPRRSEGEAFLRDATTWGEHTSDGAQRLADQLGAVASHYTPLELRVAVALSTLRDPALLHVVTACEGGLTMLRPALFRALDRRPALRRAFELLSLARFPVDVQIAEQLEADLNEVERDVLRNALVLTSEDGWVVHESIRVDPPESMTMRRSAHERLYGAFAGEGEIESRRAAVRTLERLHHAAAAGRVDLVGEDEALPDVAVLLELGRSLSLSGEHAEAAKIYERALGLDPANTYAKEYAAFNLERAGGARARALELFSDAANDEPDNPWWNRRLVVAWIRRGRVKQAGQAFRAALKGFADSSRPPGSRWLADNFHVGIAQELLRRAQLPLAREVLDSVPTEVRVASAEIAELYNRLLHREEAELTGVSVFPEDIPFGTRWDGPHFAPEAAETLAPGARWYPARIVAIGDEEVELEVGERGDGDEPATYSRRPISLQDFLEAANRRHPRGVDVGEYLDVIVQGDGTTIIHLREQQAAARPRDPWDILQGWKPDVGDLAAE